MDSRPSATSSGLAPLATAPAISKAGASATLRGWGPAALIVGLGIAAFAPTLRNGFVEVFDDAAYIAANGHVRQGLTWETVRWALSPGTGEHSYWHPLTWLSLLADVEVFGVRPGPIHAMNLALHLVAALLLCRALERMTGATWRSAAVALVFAVHPLQVESVAWAVERKAVLSGALGMGALLAWARWVERPTRWRYAGALALHAGSLLAKPALVMMPFLLLLLDVWPLGRTPLAPPARAGAAPRRTSVARLAAEKVPFLAASLAAVAVMVLARWDARATGSGVSLGLRVANAFTGAWWYVVKIAWPAGLAPYYPQAQAIPAWRAVAAAAALAGVLGACWVARRRISLGPAVGWAWFLVALAPVSGIFRTGLWPGTADRFAYLPLIGVALALAWTAGAVFAGTPWRARLAGAAFAAGAVALAAATHAQVRLWSDPVTLFAHAVKVTAPNRVSWSNLGNALQSSGRRAEARAVFEAMARILPDLPDGPLNLGVLLHEQGDFVGAEAAYDAALARDAACGQAHFNRGLIRKRRGDRDGALAEFESAVAVGFRQPVAFDQLGQAYEGRGRWVEAEGAYREALRQDPLHWPAEARLARLHAARGRAADAASVLAHARRHARLAGADPAMADEIAGAPRGAGPGGGGGP